MSLGAIIQKNFPETARYIHLPPSAPFLMGLDKPFNRAVIGPFNIIGEKTCRQLTCPPVIGQAIAADAFTAAGFVAAVAPRGVALKITLPHTLLLSAYVVPVCRFHRPAAPLRDKPGHFVPDPGNQSRADAQRRDSLPDQSRWNPLAPRHLSAD